jgi:hypothetical protein
MPTIPEQPVDARNLASFGTADTPAAAIRYDVPLPGAYSFCRVQPLRVPSDYFSEAARTAGRSLRDVGVVADAGGTTTLDRARLREWLEQFVPPRSALLRTGPAAPRPEPPAPAPVSRLLGTVSPAATAFLDDLADRAAERSAAGGRLVLELPVRGLGAAIRTVPVDTAIDQPATPTLAIIETYQLSSFLADYGLGRTLQTYSLLPGEATTISIETWRSSSSTAEQSSSVFDSADSHAEERFTDEVERVAESRDTESGTWASSLAGSGGGGFSFFGLVNASAKLDTYDAATSQYARDDFSRAVSRATSEHASQVNNARQQTVQAKRVDKVEKGDSSTTVRQITNTNLRRVLNFVFRELNQTYQTVTSLIDIRLAFYNGREGSAEIVPLSGLRDLLESVVVPERRDEVARKLLSAVVQHEDVTGTPHVVLQRGIRTKGAFTWTDASLDDDGTLRVDESPLDPQCAWRVKPGPIGQQGEDRSVPGVVTDRQDIVLRTDNVVVEALLGQADALDPYATAVQALDLRSREADVALRQAETARITAALDLVGAQALDARVAAWEKVLGDKPEISVVPVASVQDGAPR